MEWHLSMWLLDVHENIGSRNTLKNPNVKSFKNIMVSTYVLLRTGQLMDKTVKQSRTNFDIRRER